MGQRVSARLFGFVQGLIGLKKDVLHGQFQGRSF